MALTRGLVALLLIAGCGLFAPPVRAEPVAGDPAFSITHVGVDVTAVDAAEARAQALAEGQRRAFRRLVERLVPPADYGRLPTAPDGVITELVQGFEVADERVGPNRYIASLTFHFKPGAVGRLLRGNGIPYAESASQPLVAVPVYQRGKEFMLWEDGNAWREAWANLPPSDSLVPVIVPIGELADLEIVDADQARAGDRERLDRLAERYGAGEAVVIEAVADSELPLNVPKVSVTVSRYQGEGVRLGGGTYSGMAWDTLETVLAVAAAATRAQLENEWKEANLLRFDREDSLAVDIPLTGLADWIDIKNQLGRLALVRELEIAALSPRFARVVLHYLGDSQQLAGALARHDLALAREADLWILHRRGEAPGDGPSGARAGE